MSKKQNKKKFNELSKGDPNRILVKKSGTTRFIKAVCSGDEKLVQYFIKCGATIDLADKSDRTPLHHAASLGHDKIVSLLLSENASFNTLDKKGETALFKAVANGHSAVAERLLDLGVNVDISNKEGQLALHVAAKNSSMEVVQKLLPLTKKPNQADKKGVAPFHLAAEHNVKSVVEALLFGQTIDLSSVDKKGYHALHYAFRNKDPEILEILFETSAISLLDVANHEFGQTLLHMAVENKDHNMVWKLIDLGTQLDVLDKGGYSAMAIAVEDGDLEMVELLTSRGFDVSKEIKVKRGKKPAKSLLSIALVEGKSSIIDFLLEQNIDVNIRNERGQTPLMTALSTGKNKFVRKVLETGADVSLLDKEDRNVFYYIQKDCPEEIFEKLVKSKGADINKKDTRGGSALIWAIKRSRVSYGMGQGIFDNRNAQLFIKHGADVNVLDEAGRTALHCAVESRNTDLVKILLDAKANPVIPMTEGYSIVHISVYQDSPEILKLLLDAGADVNSKDKFGDTILEHAINYGSYDLVEILLEKGADLDLVYTERGETIYDVVKRHHGKELLDLIDYHLKKKNGANQNTPPPKRKPPQKGFKF